MVEGLNARRVICYFLCLGQVSIAIISPSLSLFFRNIMNKPVCCMNFVENVRTVCSLVE